MPPVTSGVDQASVPPTLSKHLSTSSPLPLRTELGSAGRGGPLGEVGEEGYGVRAPEGGEGGGPDRRESLLAPHHVVPEDTPVAGDATTAPACPRAMCGRESERKRGAQPHNGWGWGRGRPFLKPPLESP